MKIAGTIKHISLIDSLHNINVPTLLINGKDDLVRDVATKPFFDHLAKVRWVKFMDSTHMPFLEEREKYMALLHEFMTP